MSNLNRPSTGQLFQQWISFEDLQPELKQELVLLQGEPLEIEERFYTDLAFGTGGLRGVLGAGTNRMNIYTVRKASLALARDLQEQYQGQNLQVVIAYDCRHQSAEFAHQAALTLNQEGITVALFSDIRPTPQLSFAVRQLHAHAGIVVTASHNPPEYNGFKVYGADGAQINLETTERIAKQLQMIHNELEIAVLEKDIALEEGKLFYLDEHMDQAYVDYVASLSLRPEVIAQAAEEYRLVFTPLHGTALYPATQVLKHAGFQHVHLVKEQTVPDPEFSTVSSPNPEEKEAFKLAIQYAQQVGAHVIMGTDPDADRMGVVVADQDGEYRVLTGNQTGALLLHYILAYKQEQQTLQPEHVLCKTIVTSEFGRALADAYGIQTLDTLTGFKFIGEKIKEFEGSGAQQFLFGYEESYGYLIGDQVRDKDAIQAVLLVAEMGAYYFSQGMTLIDALERLYEQYGYYKEKLLSVTLKGLEGLRKIEATLVQLRKAAPTKICGIDVAWIEDYQSGRRLNPKTLTEEQLTLPQSNVLKYILTDGTWICVRPSGTEPKLKVYIGVKGSSASDADERLEQIATELAEQWLPQ